MSADCSLDGPESLTSTAVLDVKRNAASRHAGPLVKPVFDKPECQDGIMLVTPRPGVSRDNLLKALQSAYTDVYNLRGGGAARNAYERLLACIEWTSAAVRMLGSQVSNGDPDRLVLTERYRLLLKIFKREGYGLC